MLRSRVADMSTTHRGGRQSRPPAVSLTWWTVNDALDMHCLRRATTGRTLTYLTGQIALDITIQHGRGASRPLAHRAGRVAYATAAPTAASTRRPASRLRPYGGSVVRRLSL